MSTVAGSRIILAWLQFDVMTIYAQALNNYTWTNLHVSFGLQGLHSLPIHQLTYVVLHKSLQNVTIKKITYS